MSVRRLVRFAAMLLTVLLLLTAGLYVLVYLYRWEWNRAIVSGLFFLAALITFSTVLILRRLGGLEERLGDHERTRQAMEQVLSVFPAHSEARYYLATAYRGLGRLDDARLQFEQHRQMLEATRSDEPVRPEPR